MAGKKAQPTPKSVQGPVKAQNYGVVGARSGGYGKSNTRNTVATGGRRGSKLRGGQATSKPYRSYTP